MVRQDPHEIARLQCLVATKVAAKAIPLPRRARSIRNSPLFDETGPPTAMSAAPAGPLKRHSRPAGSAR